MSSADKKSKCQFFFLNFRKFKFLLEYFNSAWKIHSNEPSIIGPVVLELSNSKFCMLKLSPVCKGLREDF